VGRVEDFRKLRLCPDNIKIVTLFFCCGPWVVSKFEYFKNENEKKKKSFK
jgi:hypothetical protein